MRMKRRVEGLGCCGRPLGVVQVLGPVAAGAVAVSRNRMHDERAKRFIRDISCSGVGTALLRFMVL